MEFISKIINGMKVEHYEISGEVANELWKVGTLVVLLII